MRKKWKKLKTYDQFKVDSDTHPLYSALEHAVSYEDIKNLVIQQTYYRFPNNCGASVVKGRATMVGHAEIAYLYYPNPDINSRKIWTMDRCNIDCIPMVLYSIMKIKKKQLKGLKKVYGNDPRKSKRRRKRNRRFIGR